MKYDSEVVAAIQAHTRKSNERDMEFILRQYVLDSVGPRANKRYQYGGLINLLYTVQKVAEQLADDADNLGCNEDALRFASKMVEDAAFLIDERFLGRV